MTIFRLTLHPASDGDALMLTWGESTAPHFALVDLGRTKDYRALKPFLKKIAVLDLLAISHIDADHIEGAIPLFKEQQLPVTARQVWFNAYAQLESANMRLPPAGRVPLGAAQAEKVTAGIVRSNWPWNSRFASGIVSIDSPEAQVPMLLEGDLKLMLLSPSDRKLADLLPVWDDEMRKAGLRTTDPDEVEEALVARRVRLGGLNVEDLARSKFKEDVTKPNGASIAFVAECNSRRVLMGADSHPETIERSLRRLGASETTPYKLDCMKVPHHGSKANTSPKLLKIIDCTCFAFSTDGSRHGHPDPETIARVIKNDPARMKTLVFNFRQDSSIEWDDPDLMRQWNYECIFPDEGRAGIELELHPNLVLRSL